MKPQILIREPNERDRDAIAEVDALATSGLRQVYRPNQKAFDNLSRISPSLTPLVATIGTNVVGTVKYRIEGNRLYLTALSVHPSHRRRGVATALVRATARIAEERDIPYLAVHTVKETGNVTIFERMGFFTVGEQKDDFFESDVHDSLTDVYMERVVDEENPEPDVNRGVS